jgi:hypothetical protein
LSPTPLVYKTGRESFPFIRLLNELVVVTHTSVCHLEQTWHHGNDDEATGDF